jgi:HJR/Mrr/RecB family endonuclease
MYRHIFENPTFYCTAGLALVLMLLKMVLAIVGTHRKKARGGNHKNGHEYERAVARYLRRNGYWAVKVTGGSGGDYGVDITARKGLLRKYAVQCKRYSSPVGVRAVQEVVGGMRVYNCNRAMVVTNNTYTRQARVLAEENGVILKERVCA